MTLDSGWRLSLLKYFAAIFKRSDQNKSTHNNFYNTKCKVPLNIADSEEFCNQWGRWRQQLQDSLHALHAYDQGIMIIIKINVDY